MEEKNLELKKENNNELLKNEYTLLALERQRRSNEQKEYLKYLLISITGQFGILIYNFLSSNNLVLKNIETFSSINLVLFVISCIIVIITTILFFFWLDHALTIAVIDQFFKEKEIKHNILGWYRFRENYSKTAFFYLFGIKIDLMKLKFILFTTSIVVSFLIPPTLFLILAFFINVPIEKYKIFIEYFSIFIFSIFTLILIIGLIIWIYSSIGLYLFSKSSKKK